MMDKKTLLQLNELYKKFISKYIIETNIYALKDFPIFKLKKQDTSKNFPILRLKNFSNSSAIEKMYKNEADSIYENAEFKRAMSSLSNTYKFLSDIKFNEWKKFGGFTFTTVNNHRYINLGKMLGYDEFIIESNDGRPQMYVLIDKKYYQLEFILPNSGTKIFFPEKNILLKTYNDLCKDDVWWNTMNLFYDKLHS
jgi:hypothetical protein